MRRLFKARRPLGRLSYLLAWFCLVALTPLAAQAPQTTQIADVVYRSDGTPAQGTILISCGASQLTRATHNYFGIKAHGGGPFLELLTQEVVDGKVIRVTARFARYASMAECFADRDATIARLPLYAEARAAAAHPEAFIRALGRYWATDPAYAEKVLHIYRAESLAALDSK